ncbi:MAG: dienelactone hydrolase family protein [Phycisphaerae bacterium]|nr:dienelactone hydrolase family protein [Phycisphaerae bacterium]
MRHAIVAAFLAFIAPALASAKVQTKEVEYTHGGVTFKGYLAWDDAVEGKRPGVMVVHEWWGLNDYAKSRARQLAELGYVGFACDMYGNGQTTTDPAEAGRLAGGVAKDWQVLRGRALAGVKAMAEQPMVDAARLGAIGYCFGGTTCLQLACAGADVKAVVAFHGGLFKPTEADARAIKSRVLICNGAADTFISADDRAAMLAAFEAAKVDYQFIDYAGAVHAFTNPEAGRLKMKGVDYDEKADQRSWRLMQDLFKEAFAK